MTLNIQKRLFKAISTIEMILSHYEIDILFLQETDIRADEVPPIIEGYESFHHTNNGGVIRVITYVRVSIAATNLVWDQDLPVVIIKLKNVTLVNIYNEFTLNSYTKMSKKITKRQQMERLKKMIVNTYSIGNRIVWIGDVNLDLINSPLASTFIEFCDNYGIRIENWNATRVNACLDQILNFGSSIHSIQIIDSYVSDHSMIVFKLGKEKSVKTIVSKVQIIPDQDLACWNSSPLAFIQMDHDICLFTSEIRDINHLAYRLTYRMKRSKHPSWFFHKKLVELREQIRKADPAVRKKLKNRYINISRRIKIDESETLPVNKFWNLVRKKERALTIDINGKLCDDEQLVADRFAENMMSDEVFHPLAPDSQLLGRCSSHFWSFKYVTPEDVRKRIKYLKPKNSVGPDGLSPAFLKKIGNGISTNLANLINMIVINGHYPEGLALGRIKPVFKGKGSAHKETNFRPILVKNALAKIVDSILFGDQLNSSLERHLTPNMFAYRTMLGTDDAIIRIREKIIGEVQNGNKVMVVTWDIMKAFEQLPHQVMLESIARTGASEAASNVISSYIASQASFVQVGRAKSRIIANKCRGMGQGTHLAGPVFNISTIQTTAEERLEFSTRYSDDDLELVVARTDEELRVKLAEVLRDKKYRVSRIGLKLQDTKTKLWTINSGIDEVCYEGLTLSPIKNLKHLGVVLQKDLKPLSHLEQTIVKLKIVAARIRALGDLPRKYKLAAYYAWAQSAVLYNGISYLPFLTGNQLKKLQSALNLAIRVVIGCPFMIRSKNGEVKFPSITKMRRSWRIPSVELLKNIVVAKRCWKFRSKYRELEQAQISKTGIVTRNVSNLRIPLARGLVALSVELPCIRIWNIMPATIKNEENKEKAFRMIKKWLARSFV